MLRQNVWLNVTFATNIFAPLHRPTIFFYSTTAETFNVTKTLSQTFINEQISFMRENCELAFLSHRLGAGQTDRQTDGQNYDPQDRASITGSRSNDYPQLVNSNQNNIAI